MELQPSSAREVQVRRGKSKYQREQARQRRAMKRSEMTRQLVDEKRRDVESKHIDEIRVSPLLMQTCPFAGAQDTHPKNQSRDSGPDMKSRNNLIYHD